MISLKQHQLSVTGFFIILAGFLFFPLLNATITAAEALQVAAVIFFLYAAGFFIVEKSLASLELTDTFRTGLSVVAASLLFFLLLPFQHLFTGRLWIFAVIDLLLLVYFIYTRQIKIGRLLAADILIFTVTVLHILQHDNYTEIMHRLPVQRADGFMDNYWFTSMAASIKDGNFSNSIFEQGVGVYYHLLGFIPAAVVSVIAHTPVHLSLWGLVVPSGTFLAFYAVFELAALFILVIKKNIYKTVFFFFIFYFLIPLNLKYVLKLKFDMALWDTDPFNLPLLPAWNMFYVLGCLLFIHIFRTTSYKIKQITAGSILLLLIILAKVTGFYIIAVIAGTYALLQWFYEKKTGLLLSVLAAGLLSLVIVKFFFAGSSAKFIVQPGYLVSYLTGQTGYVATSTFLLWIRGILIFGALMLLWFNWRLIGLFFFPAETLAFNRKYFIIALSISLISCFVLTNTFHIKSFTRQGKEFIDSSFDLMQFFRSYFIIICVLGPVGIFLMLQKQSQNFFFKTVKIAVMAWLAFCCFCFAYSKKTKSRPQPVTDTKWSDEVVSELKKTTHKKLFIQSDKLYSGQFISAFEVGNWYLTNVDRDGGYSLSTVNLNKYAAVDSLLSGQVNESSIRFVETMKEDEVDIFVASPQNISRADSLVAKGIFSRVTNTHWLYELK